jgi:hypothetical protein
MSPRGANRGSLASDLARLPDLDRLTLMEQWRKLYRTEPPARIGNNFLISAIACRLQEQALGGLKPSTQRYLAGIAGDASGSTGPNEKKVTAPPTVLKPGARLLREWHGITHEVVVLEDGVMFKGKRYRSLSEVARTITGTRWSGPLFFGVRRTNSSKRGVAA